MSESNSADYEALKKIIEGLDQERGKTVKKLELINEGQKKWTLIQDVYHTGFPKIQTIGMMTGTAGQTIHYVADGVAEKIKEQMDMAFLNDVISSGDSVMSTLMTANASIASPLPKELVTKLEQEASGYHKAIRNNVTVFLGEVAPHLVDTYKGAWTNFDTSWNDAERGASALMREVINQLLGILTPQELETRAARIDFIAENLSKNEDSKNRIKEISRAYLDTIDYLNKMHQRSAMNKGEVEGFLYQANNLLNTFADNIDLAKIRGAH